MHVLSHALHYGTAYFEGIRCYELADGRSAVFRLQEHMQRLADSGKILGFPLPYSVEQLCQATLEVIRANKLKACYIRPLAFLGLGELGVYAPQQSGQRVHRGVALGRLSGRRGHQERHSRQGVVLHPPSRQRDHDQEQDLGELRQFGARQGGSEKGRLR